MKRYALTALLCIALISPAYASYNPSLAAMEKEQAKLEAMGGKFASCSQEQQYMFGDWKCLREEIANEGVLFSSTFTCDVLGDVSGGKQRAVRYDHSMGWDINFDLEKFAQIQDTQFHISGLWRQGRNLSKEVIGNDLVASSIFGSEQFRFYAIYLEKLFFDQKLSIKAGRIATGDDFAFSPLYWTYVSNAVDGCPINIPINMFFPVYPTAVWGARAKIVLNKDFYMMSGIYNGDKTVGYDKYAGLNFSLRLSRGVAFAQEIAYVPNTSPDSKGLPGHYKAGFYYNGAVVRDLYSDGNGSSYAATGLPQKKRVGNYNVYLHADQMLYRAKGTVDNGLTALAVTAIGPDNVNKFPFLIMGGLIYKGLIPGRDNDLTAFEAVYSQYSKSLRRSEKSIGNSGQTYELMIEFTQKIMVTKWMFIQPDLQYIIRPGGTGDTENALVVGSRFGLSF